MATRNGRAIWQGDLQTGTGAVTVGNGVFSGNYSFKSRFEDGDGTNPEELIGAAHAGCFSMFLSALLTDAGFPPTRIETTAAVHLEAGPTIRKIELNCEAEVPRLDQIRFARLTAQAKAECPVSKALAAVDDIVLRAKLAQ